MSTSLFPDIKPAPDTAALAERLEAWETPPKALVDLMAARPDIFADAPRLWEPFAGTGILADTLRAAGHEVFANDVHNWGYPQLDDVVDTWAIDRAKAPVVVTNPPFSRAHEAVSHLLEIGVQRVVMFQAWNWFLGTPDKAPGAFMDCCPPQGLFPLLGRYSPWRFDIPDNQRTSSSPIRWCWYVWRADGIAYAPPVERIPRAVTRVPVSRAQGGAQP